MRPPSTSPATGRPPSTLTDLFRCFAWSRLEKVELAPFRAAIGADVAAVMTAHIAVPSLDGRKDRPATFSPEILKGLLREEMKFRGLIVSDALDMGGARDGSWGGAVVALRVAHRSIGEAHSGSQVASQYTVVELPQVSAVVTVYDFSAPSQRALAKALFGEIDVGGTLPVRLSEKYPVGYGISLERRKMELGEIESPKEAGFSEARLRIAAGVLDDALKSKVFPGGVVVMAREGKLVMERAFGRLSYAKDAPPVTMDTIYDVASLTKVVVTATLAMVLFEKEELRLEALVRDYLPEFVGVGKDVITVADLLAHSSGILWWKDYYKTLSSEGSAAEVRRRYVEEISRLPLDYPSRSKSVYSDLGFILLGEILDRVSGRSLDAMATEAIFKPLGMGHTRFNPPASPKPRIASTEDDPWRGRIVTGDVHDENAFALGGVAPHAGLFSTARDLAVFAQMILNGGVYDGHRIVKRSTIERFTRRADLAPDSSRALGWDTPSRPPKPSSVGRYFSSSSFGEYGFTGTSLWIDPEQELFVVLLTNRVHPSRDNMQIREVRPAFHDAVMEALTDVPRPRQ